MRQKSNYKSNYKILGLVGRGQFGKVFVAIDRHSGILVALKELNLKQLSTSSFLREFNFLVTLDHFNLVSCRALEHRHNNRYIVMDYCEGGTLRHLLDYSPQLTLKQSLKLIIDLLSGLKFAHDQGVIHRDIKPENILLKVSDRFWTAHISDFGIAKLHQETIAQGAMGDTGSPAYMAPEQFYGKYSYSCDLYAVGIILYELVVGKRPFSGMPKELLAAHLNQPVKIPQNMPFVLRSAIAKALQKMPQRRFQNAAEMLKSLQLIQTILETDHYTQIPTRTTLDSKSLTPSCESLLAHKITHLAIASEQVYLGHGTRFELRCYRDSSLEGAIVNQWSMTLDKPIRNLQLNSQGCMISTLSSIYYLPQDTTTPEFHFFVSTLLPVASFPTNNLVCTIDSLGYWLAASYLPTKSKTPILEIFKSPNCQLWRSQINRQLWKTLIALDRRRGLGMYQNGEGNSEFHLFNRRGNWLANFTLKTQLDLISYNPLFLNQILATEVNNSGAAILISFEKFKTKRIDLHITPHLVVSCPQGYLFSDRQGRIALVEGNSHQVIHYQIPLPSESYVTAIAFSETQLLVASASVAQSYLQRFEVNCNK